jgi:hypothetical protein
MIASSFSRLYTLEFQLVSVQLYVLGQNSRDMRILIWGEHYESVEQCLRADGFAVDLILYAEM